MLAEHLLQYHTAATGTLSRAQSRRCSRSVGERLGVDRMHSPFTTLQRDREAIVSVECLRGLGARLLIGAPFLFCGLSMLADCADVGHAMAATGASSVLLAIIDGFAVFSSCAFIIGWRPRTAAGLLVCLSVLSAWYNDSADRTAIFLFSQIFATVGALLFITAYHERATRFDDSLARAAYAATLNTDGPLREQRMQREGD